jgi:arylsulfatase A-like enzyme
MSSGFAKSLFAVFVLLAVAAAIALAIADRDSTPVETFDFGGLDDPDYAVRFRAAMAFVESEDEELESRLGQMLSHTTESHRARAALEFVRWKRAGGSLPAGENRKGGKPNVLLISIDTLRADHLGCYGYARPTSPNIDALANRGVLFENAFSPASWTLPGHMSMFTSLYPSFHKLEARRGSLRLDSSERTLAESLKDAGYRTVSFVTHPYLAAKWGFDQGFDLYFRQKTVVRAAEQTQSVIDWLDWHVFHERRGLEPGGFFLFVHYMDPHETYNAPEPFGNRYTGRYDGSLKPDDHFVTIFKRLNFTSPADYEYVLALYDGEISYVDDQVGRLLDRLDERRLLDSTVVALTSDHGEEFKEHGGMGHKSSVHVEQLRVPLIITHPSAIKEGQRVSSQASLVDIYPTLVGLIGEKSSAAAQGIDLGRFFTKADEAAPAAHEEAPTSPPQFGELGPLDRSWEAPFRKRAIRTDRYKLILNFENGSKKLFDIRTDPVERHDLYASMRNDPEIRDLERRLMAFIEAGAAHNAGSRLRNEIELDQKVREQLRALGYAE